MKKLTSKKDANITRELLDAGIPVKSVFKADNEIEVTFYDGVTQKQLDDAKAITEKHLGKAKHVTEEVLQ